MFPNFEFQSSEPHCSLKTKKYYYSFKTTWRFYVGVLTFSIFFKLSSSRSLDQEVAESLEEWAGSHVRAEVNFQIKDWGSGTGAHPVTGFILSGISWPASTKKKVCKLFRGCRVQWGSEIQKNGIRTFWRSDFKCSGFKNGRVIAIVPAIWNPDILVQIKMIFDKMATICPDFKWLGFRILDPIRNPDHL